MRQHPLDREMGLAGVGRPEHRGDARAGRPFLAERRRESHNLQVFLFIAGAFRHCERSEAIHGQRRKNGLLRRCAPRNDEKTLNSFVVWHHLRRFCFTMRRIDGRGLSSGTVKERIVPESVTRALSGFVHRNISRWRLRCGTRSSLARLHKGPISGEILKRCEACESNQKWERVKPKSRALSLPSPLRGRVGEGVHTGSPDAATPLPNPPPQGGREQREARRRAVARDSDR